ncbi:MAG: NIPSNAP family protein [Rhodoferax sp.]
MLIEERCYVLHATSSPQEFLEAYKTLGQEVQTKTLGGLVGYYVTEVGELNAIVSLWRYESFEDRQTRRAELAKNPQWHAYLAKVRPMLKSMNNRLMNQVI